MKRGTPEHPKVMRLAKVLGVRRHVAVGLLEMLWHLTARYTPAGDVGKWSDDEIASALDWDHDAARLIGALVACGLLEQHPVHRLIVHDWAEHADDGVRILMKRRELTFVSPHVGTCSDIIPLPKPLPLPLPEPKPKPFSLRERRATSHRIPATETLTEARRADAIRLGIPPSQVDAVWAEMGDVEFKTPRSDWSATFRQSCRRWLRTQGSGNLDDAAAQVARVQERLRKGL